MKKLSIYVHIPFCQSKCAYCAFASFVRGADEKEKYVSALCEEIERRKCDKVVQSVYFGGGTPSVLVDALIERILSCIKANFHIDENAEITIEANPSSLTFEKLEFWKNLGFNRVSIGVQSLNDENLRKIGRLHTKKQALAAVQMAKSVFENVSCDLLVGLQEENGQVLCEHAQALIDAGAVHLSCYLLEIYPNTKIAKMVENGEFLPLDDDATIDAFETLSAFLRTKGFERYEISNFARKNFESRHNLNYWARGEYLGFGLGAHSFVEESRIENADDFENYYKNITKCENLSGEERVEEKIMLGLRCRLGVNLSDLEGYDIKKNPYFREYLEQNVLHLDGDILRLDQAFYDVSNTIISNLFEK